MSIPSEHKTDMRAYRWGILATGKISQDFVNAISVQSNVIINAVASRSLDSAKAFAKRFTINRYYGSYAELFEDAEVDIIYIGSLHPNHFSHLCAAIEKGKHVLCEKPMVINAKQAEIVFDLARKHNVFVMEAAWHRFIPWCVKLRQLLAENAIGEVRNVYCDFGIAFPESNQRTVDPYQGGGSLLDLGVYTVNITNMIFGGAAPTKVMASGFVNEEKVDSQVAAVIEYGPNQQAVISSSRITHTPCELVVCGTKGIIRVWDDEMYWHAATKLSLKLTGQKAQVFEFEEPQNTATFHFWHSHMLHYEAIEAERCLREGRTQSEVMPWKDTITVMKTLDEIRRQIGAVYPDIVESTDPNTKQKGD